MDRRIRSVTDYPERAFRRLADLTTTIRTRTVEVDNLTAEYNRQQAGTQALETEHRNLQYEMNIGNWASRLRLPSVRQSLLDAQFRLGMMQEQLHAAQTPLIACWAETEQLWEAICQVSINLRNTADATEFDLLIQEYFRWERGEGAAGEEPFDRHRGESARPAGQYRQQNRQSHASPPPQAGPSRSSGYTFQGPGRGQQQAPPPPPARPLTLNVQALRQWREYTLHCFEDYATIQEFPDPSARNPVVVTPCTKPQCHSEERALAACHCQLIVAFSALDVNIRREMIAWHPDRFSRCAEEKRRLYEVMATEVFQALSTMNQRGGE